jgi:hypothetical protein
MQQIEQLDKVLESHGKDALKAAIDRLKSEGKLSEHLPADETRVASANRPWCIHCGKSEPTPQYCGSCKRYGKMQSTRLRLLCSVAYCSKDCQRTHWQNGHKQACASLAYFANSIASKPS